MFNTFSDGFSGINGFTSKILDAQGRGFVWVKGPTKIIVTDSSGDISSPIYAVDYLDFGGTDVLDSNGNILLAFDEVVDAENYVKIFNAVAGDNPYITTDGVDAAPSL